MVIERMKGGGEAGRAWFPFINPRPTRQNKFEMGCNNPRPPTLGGV